MFVNLASKRVRTVSLVIQTVHVSVRKPKNMDFISEPASEVLDVRWSQQKGGK